MALPDHIASNPSSGLAFRKLDALNRQYRETSERMDSIVEPSTRENRDLHPDEERAFAEAERLLGEIRADIDRLEELRKASILPRQTRDAPRIVSGGADGPGEARGRGAADGPTLAREQRMADWGAERLQRSDYSPEEAEHFSLGRMVRGMVTGNWRDAEVERRALGEGTTGAGGALTPEVLSLQVIDRIRAATRVLEAGALTVPLESDQHSIPRLAGGVTGTWKIENMPVDEQNPTFQRVTFAPKTLAVLVKLSYELFEDMTSSSADLITNELVQGLSVTIDKEALAGTGALGGPTGLRNYAGIDVQSLGVNGAALTDWGPLVDGVSAVQARNIDPNALLYAPRTGKSLAKLKDTTNQPLQPPRLLDGIRQLSTSQISTTITQGTSGDCSEIYAGRWSDLLIGFRPAFGVRVVQARERFIDNLQIGLVAWARMDVQLAHTESFTVVTGVRP